MKNLVSTDWLEKNLDNVRIFDGSWHLPNSNRNALGEFQSAHIKNSNFFDIDKNSDHQSNHTFLHKEYLSDTLLIIFLIQFLLYS